MTLKFTILGCGSSAGVPRPALGWGACDSINPKNRRRRTSLLVERHNSGGVTRVLIDTPPINLLSDAALLGAVADAVLLVVRAGHTHVEALRYAMDRLTTARVPVIGTLLNDIDPKRSATYDGSYRYLNDIERYYVAGNGHGGDGT